jgi:hypothetical protein
MAPDPYAPPAASSSAPTRWRMRATHVALALIAIAGLLETASSSRLRVLGLLVGSADGALGNGFTWGNLAALLTVA